MIVLGFDFGNEDATVSVARQMCTDDGSENDTPDIKDLVGRKFSDSVLQRNIKSLAFDVSEGPDGYPLIHLGETQTYTPTQVLGIVLSDLEKTAEKDFNAEVVDCCIGIPLYFSDVQKRAVVDESQIAGLNFPKLCHEATAIALAYGFYKTDLLENDQLNVAFVDIGHASMQVCIAGFTKGQLKVLAHSFDSSLGSRDFDDELFQLFAAKLNDEYKIDVYQNPMAFTQLESACKKLKKVLSANPEAL